MATKAPRGLSASRVELLLAGLRACEHRPRRALAGRLTPWDLAARIRQRHADSGAHGRAMQKPLFAGWGITDRCNSDCIHCWSTGVGCGYQLSEQDALRVADRLVESQVLCVTLSGGEPFLRPDLFEVIGSLKQKPLGVEILSNGSLIQRHGQAVGRLLCGPGDLIQVSLDGPDPETYLRQRGSDLFDAALRGIAALADAGILVRAHCVVTYVNVTRLAEIYRLARSVGAAEFSVVPAAAIGRGSDIADKLDPHCYLDRMACVLEEAGARNGGPAVTFKGGFALFALACEHGLEPPKACRPVFFAGDQLERICINLDGSVYPSSLPYGYRALGNLVEAPLHEFLPPTDDCPTVRDLSRTCCARCPGVDVCQGGDPRAAFAASGTIDAPDPHCPVAAGAGKGESPDV